MTRQIRLLTKLSLYGMFGLNELRHTKDTRKKRMALPFSHKARIFPFSSREASGSSPTKGSSRIRRDGAWTRAAIMAVRCFIPWE